MRKLFWRLHSLTGLIVGLGLLVVGFAGILLLFHEQIDASARPGELVVTPTESGRLPFGELVATVDAALPEFAVVGWTLGPRDPARADQIAVLDLKTRERFEMTVDPYRGTVLSAPHRHEDSVREQLLALHRGFYLGNPGRAISGVFGLALCFQCVSGLWIYRRFWRTLFRLRLRSSARLLFGDLHRLVGVWAVGFLLLVAVTGAYWNLTHVAQNGISPARKEPPRGEPITVRVAPGDLPLDAILARAGEALGGFEPSAMAIPAEPGGKVLVWGRPRAAAFWRSRDGSRLTFDVVTGELVAMQDQRKFPLKAQVLDAFEPLHYGDFGGFPIKALWAFGGMSPGLLTLSGTLIWLKRRRAAK